MKTTALSLVVGSLCTGTVWAQGAAPSPAPAPAPFTREVERCIVPAATYHQVNPLVLRAILVVESGLNPRAVGKNANGTVDVGLGQMNSMHFKELSQWGISPGHLMDPCISTYVAAWHLKKSVDQGGNTWAGVARYHSATPYFNQRYQVLLFNELVRTGVVQGPRLPVPPLRTGTAPGAARARGAVTAQADPPLIVHDAGR